jgi:hypothetical protein
MWWCCELAYISSTAVLKASICIFLNRICVRKSQKITIWVVLGGVIAFSIFYFFLIVFQCQPVVYFWTQYLGDSGKCVNPNVIADSTYAHSAVSAAVDVTIPSPCLASLILQCWASRTMFHLPRFSILE